MVAQIFIKRIQDIHCLLRLVFAEPVGQPPLREDIRVLLKTSNSALWNGEGFHEDYTHLTEAGARYLVDQVLARIVPERLSSASPARQRRPRSTRLSPPSLSSVSKTLSPQSK